MENFPNLTKEIDFLEVQEAQRVPKRLDSKKHTPRHIIITLPKIKDEESWLVWLRGLIECWPANLEVSGSIPSQGT